MVIGLMLSSLWSNQAAANAPISVQSKAERMVVDFYHKVFVERADVRTIAEQYMHPEYIQHNPFVADGREGMVLGLAKYLKKLPESMTFTIKGVFTDGDHVILHVHQNDEAKPEPGFAGIDIFRVEDGKIMEHWDVWQKIPETMPHDNGMF